MFCFGIAQWALSSYMKGGDKTAIAHYQQMLADSSKVMAELAAEYKEVTLKVMKVPIKSYEFQYHFAINGQNYKGQHTFTDLPKTNQLQVYYLKAAPSINCVDPAGRLGNELNNNKSKIPLYIGIFFGLLALANLYDLIKDFRDKKQAETTE